MQFLPSVKTSLFTKASWGVLSLEPSDLGALYFIANEGSHADGMIEEMRLEASRRGAREVPPDRVLVVSDNPEDHRLAAHSGADFRGLSTGRFTKDDHVAQGTPESDVVSSLASALEAPANRGVRLLRAGLAKCRY